MLTNTIETILKERPKPENMYKNQALDSHNRFPAQQMKHCKQSAFLILFSNVPQPGFTTYLNVS